MSAPERIPSRRLTSAELLARGELTVLGRIRDASNAALYCEVVHDGQKAACVYKPVAGERPLWDFPDGTLAEREVAAYEVSEATGWGLVPPTVLRDGPYGRGMCQLWVGPDAEAGDGEGAVDEGQNAADAAAADAAADDVTDTGDAEDTADAEDAVDEDAAPEDGAAGGDALLALVEADEPGPGWKAIVFVETGEGKPALLVHADDERLRRLAVLDAVINNADRKGGHLLPTAEGHLFGIDHGVTFHQEDKLRTLLWGWAGEPLTDDAVGVLKGLRDSLAEGATLAGRLAALLTAAEVDALRGRVTALLDSGHHPEPGGDWPTIPWPPV
jgi:hypothetical protein